MAMIRRKIWTALATTAVSTGFAASAHADRFVDPQTLPPRARVFALHGPLGSLDPYGRPTPAGCKWSRLQVPTAQGLRWVAQEECTSNFLR